MKREAVADRIVTYCDALVAFSLVNGLAFLVALGEPDIRCSIVAISGAVFFVNVFFPIASTLLLLWLGRYERRLRVDEPVDDLVSGFWRSVGIFRLVLIWSFACFVLLGIWGATQDVSCQAMGG
jgi:hypothetical protein